MEKRLVRMYIFTFVFIILLIAGISFFSSKIKLTGFTTLGNTCPQSIGSSGYYDMNQNLICGFGVNGVSITSSDVTLDCKGYTIKGTVAGSIGIQTSNANVKLINCNITNFDYNVYLNGANNAQIIDSHIEKAGGTNELYLDSNSFNNTLLNTTHNQANDFIDTGSNYTKQWYLDVNVTWDNGTAVSGAYVNVFNDTTNANYSGTTNSNGLVRFNVTQYTKTSATTFNYNTYNITATVNPSNSTIAVITTNRLVQLTLQAPVVNNPPVVSLVIPADNLKSSNKTQNFSCSATDDVNLANITLYVWNSTGEYNKTTTEATGHSNQTSWILENIPDGNYTWNCLAYDNITKNDWDANRTFYIDSIPPAFTNLTNKEIYNNQSLNFDINATDAGLGVNCFAVNDTSKFSIDCAGVLKNTTALSIGMYWLNISVNDTLNNLNSSVISINVSNFDISHPTINLIVPVDAYPTTLTSITFQYNVSDMGNIENCSLIIGGAIVNTSATIVKNATQDLSQTLAVGSYVWSVNCTDEGNNQNNSVARTLTITSNGGGSGGGGGSCSDECVNKMIAAECIDLTTIKSRTCGNYDSDSCFEWNNWTINACPQYQTCQNNVCVCNNQCSPANYPKRQGNKIVLCVTENTCNILAYQNCTEESCENSTIENSTSENSTIGIETPSSGGGGGGGANIETPFNPLVPSSYIPHGKIPDKVVDAAVYTGGAVLVVYTGNLLWLWLLTLLFPFLMLRLKHYCVSLITPEIKLKTKAEIEAFILVLSAQFGDLVYKAEEKENFYKFVFRTSGFLEIHFEKELIINAHFTSLLRAEKFKFALIKLFDKMFEKKTEMNKRDRLIGSIAITKETASIMSMMRSLMRAAKIKSLGKQFKKSKNP